MYNECNDNNAIHTLTKAQEYHIPSTTMTKPTSPTTQDVPPTTSIFVEEMVNDRKVISGINLNAIDVHSTPQDQIFHLIFEHGKKTDGGRTRVLSSRFLVICVRYMDLISSIAQVKFNVNLQEKFVSVQSQEWEGN